MIRARALAIHYPGAPQPAPAGLDLHVREGETMLLLGPSGSGKSSLALALAGVIPHGLYARVQGELTVAGRDPRQVPAGHMAATVGVLFQDPEASFATLVVEDELAFGLENLRMPPEAMPARITQALERVGMQAFRHRRLETLSGGEAQRVALAALLAMGQPLLVLDEPTALLDPPGTRAFFASLARLKGRHTLLLIEHKVDACLHLVDRVVLLDAQGRVLADGPPWETLQRHRAQALQAGLWLPEALDPWHQRRFTPQTPLNERPPALAVERVTYRVQGRALVEDVTFTLPQGDFLAIVGPNGAGKSTLVHLFLGLKRPQQGRVFLFGQDVARLPFREITRMAGLVFQNPEHQFVTETVWEEVAYSLRMHGWPEARIRARVEGLLERFGLAPYARQNPFRLSQGQKRRLSVATMLALGPRLLILDEPTFGQDRRTAYALMDELAALNREGVTVVMVTHDLRLVRQYARHVLLLHRGRVRFHGPVEAFFQHPAAREMGLVEVGHPAQVGG